MNRKRLRCRLLESDSSVVHQNIDSSMPVFSKGGKWQYMIRHMTLAQPLDHGVPQRLNSGEVCQVAEMELGSKTFRFKACHCCLLSINHYVAAKKPLNDDEKMQSRLKAAI